MEDAPVDINSLAEFRDNPFISNLPPPLSQRAAWQFLSDPSSFDPEERKYPLHLRSHCLYRLGRLFEPLEQHLRLEAAFSTLLRRG